MRIMVSLEHHFVRTPQGVFTDLAFGYDYWREILEVFDEVLVLARVKKADKLADGMFRADGEGVAFIDLYDYRGLLSLICTWPFVLWQIKRATVKTDRFLLMSGQVSVLLWFWLRLMKRPYAMGFVGRTVEAISAEGSGLFRHLYKLLGRVSEWVWKIQARRASQASYTSEFLRQCYPTSEGEKEFVFSGVRITDDVLTAPRDAGAFSQRPFVMVSVGRLELQKGHAWLVESAAELASKTDLPEWKMNILGPGTQIPVLKRRVKKLGLEYKVNIVGAVGWGYELFQYLDRAHLFVLPSFTEGLPRSLVEAMARGLPAIGANTGGIPELLDKQCLVEIGDVKGLAGRIADFMTKPDSLAEMSAKNFERALNFRVEITKNRKLAFWRSILNG
jgi:glycosyltransferase involved in cell wall biosynthesis